MPFVSVGDRLGVLLAWRDRLVRTLVSLLEAFDERLVYNLK
jgi:hypothetical protein